MSYHLAAYFASVDNSGDSDVAALTDGVLSIRNNHFVFAEPTMLTWAMAMSATLARARLSQPSFNVITRPYIRPIEQNAIPASLPGVADFHMEPFLLRTNEELAVEATTGAACGENFTTLVGLTVNPQPLPSGNIFSWRGTATATLVANTWTNIGTITWDNSLPEGDYAVVGGEFISTGAQAGRLLFPGTSVKWRPGAPGQTDVAGQTWHLFRKGGLGIEWGRFNAFALPQVEMLSNSADTAEEVYLDIVKIG